MIHFLRRILGRLRVQGLGRGSTAPLVASILGLVAYGTTGFYLFEREAALAGQAPAEALGTAAWWSIVTMTTVGYGDFSPATFGGRWLVGVPLMVLGIGILGFAIGELTNWVIETQTKRRRGKLPYKGSDHILILNLPDPDLILEIVGELRADPSTADHDVVLVTDAVDELPAELVKAKVFFVRGNPCRENTLERAAVKDAHRVILLTQNPAREDCDSVTLGVLVTIRALAPNAYVVVECQREENRKLMRTARVDELVGAGAMRAELVVQGLQDPGINSFLEELLTNAKGHQIYFQQVGEFRGTYRELQDRVSEQGDYAFLGLVQDGIRTVMPPGDTEVTPGNRMIVVGPARPTPPGG